MNRVVGASVFLVHFIVGTFLFAFSSQAQKRKQANKLLFFPSMFFKHIFNFCALISVFCFCLVASLCFLVLLVRAKSFCKKRKKKSLELP